MTDADQKLQAGKVFIFRQGALSVTIWRHSDRQPDGSRYSIEPGRPSEQGDDARMTALRSEAQRWIADRLQADSE
jgi:hypothetical protein